MNLLPFLAAGAVGLFVLTRKPAASSTNAAPGSPQPLRAGVPYLFVVRLDDGVTDATVRSTLEAKGAQNLLLSPAVNPPFWAPVGAAFSLRHASFKAVPQGNGQVTLGDAFYGIGRLESLVRLDGLPFDSEGPSV